MKFVPNNLSRGLGRQILTLKKNSPTLMFGAGIAGVVVSTVLACRATLKLSDTLDEAKEDIDAVKALRDVEGYPDHEVKKDLAYAYSINVYRVAKLYAPAVIIGTASIAALTGSHVTLSRRNSGLTAAYAAVQAAFDEYRERVKEEVGEERELELHHAISNREIEVDGKKQIVKSADPNKWSQYARFFDESNPNWQKDGESNRTFVQIQQNYLNHLLNSRGHVFLNEAYDQLGLERSSAGQVVGWLVGGDGDGDGYIDFGIFDAFDERKIAFVNGLERNVILDFNVDGIIYDKI